MTIQTSTYTIREFIIFNGLELNTIELNSLEKVVNI